MKSEIQKILKSVNMSATCEVNEVILMRLNKNPLAKYVESLVNLMEKNIELCKSAAGKMDQLKSEKIADQKILLDIQKGQVDSVKDTVKSEMKSWVDVVKKNTNQRNGKQLTENSVKQAVRIVNEEERRSKNLMIYGCDEKENEATPDTVETVQDVYKKLGTFSMPKTVDIYRMGKKEAGKPRPIKIEFTTAGDVDFALAHARNLRTSNLKNVYLGPDRTKEQRVAHSKLVNEMKQMIQQDPNKHYFIRYNRICSVDKGLSPPVIPTS